MNVIGASGRTIVDDIVPSFGGGGVPSFSGGVPSFSGGVVSRFSGGVSIVVFGVNVVVPDDGNDVPQRRPGGHTQLLPTSSSPPVQVGFPVVVDVVTQRPSLGAVPDGH